MTFSKSSDNCGKLEKLAATLGLRPFGLSRGRDQADPDLDNNNENGLNGHVQDSQDILERELEESKRFFSRFAPSGSAHHSMVQYSHLGKT